MACTTILVGKKASYDGSTIIARNDDSSAGKYKPKRFVIVQHEDQPGTYTSVLSRCTVELPDNPMRYSAVPNAVGDRGLWAGCGVNEKNVGMTPSQCRKILISDPSWTYRSPIDAVREQFRSHASDESLPKF